MISALACLMELPIVLGFLAAFLPLLVYAAQKPQKRTGARGNELPFLSCSGCRLPYSKGNSASRTPMMLRNGTIRCSRCVQYSGAPAAKTADFITEILSSAPIELETGSWFWICKFFPLNCRSCLGTENLIVLSCGHISCEGCRRRCLECGYGTRAEVDGELMQFYEAYAKVTTDLTQAVRLRSLDSVRRCSNCPREDWLGEMVHCQGCSTSLCGFCAVTQHADHAIEPLSSAEHRAKKNQTLVQTLRQIQDRWSGSEEIPLPRRRRPVLSPKQAARTCKRCKRMDPIEYGFQCTDCDERCCGTCTALQHLKHTFQPLYIAELDDLTAKTRAHLDGHHEGLARNIYGIHNMIRDNFQILSNAHRLALASVSRRRDYAAGDKVNQAVVNAAINFESYLEKYLFTSRLYNEQLIQMTEALQALA